MDELIRELIENLEMKNQILMSGYEFNLSYQVNGKVFLFLHSNISVDKVELYGSLKDESEALNKCLDKIGELQVFGGHR